MFKQHNWRICRIGYVFVMILPLSVGCAFPHGSTQGDPLLGNFHRPIVRTPPPERGGIGLDTPAYDGGARIGVGVPEIPTAVENSNGFMTLPNLTFPNLFSAGNPYHSPDDVYTRNKPAGASLPTTVEGTRLNTLTKLPAMPMGNDGVVARPRGQVSSITSGASIEPSLPSNDVKLVKYETPAETVRIFTVEEGQNLLTSMGARSQRLEQSENGDWVFSCANGVKYYEGRSRDRLDAVRNVVEQIKRD